MAARQGLALSKATSVVLCDVASRRAAHNLVHRFHVVGLAERTSESMAIVAWAFGWLPNTFSPPAQTPQTPPRADADGAAAGNSNSSSGGSGGG